MISKSLTIYIFMAIFSLTFVAGAYTSSNFSQADTIKTKRENQEKISLIGRINENGDFVSGGKVYYLINNHENAKDLVELINQKVKVNGFIEMDDDVLYFIVDSYKILSK